MTTYLVQYGRSGFVGRFQADAGAQFARCDRVVIRGPRGVEIGTVLCVPSEPFAEPAADGELLRAVSDADEALAIRLDALGPPLLSAADRTGLPVAFVDIELTLDGTAILHGLPWAECDAAPVLTELATRFSVCVQLLDLSRSLATNDTPDHAGCGKPGCGSESGGCTACGTGGCSTGSCSRGKVGSADELTAYFSRLRQQMEAAGRTPLV
jgi:hypothetical protein